MVEAKPFFGMIETVENGESLDSLPRTMIDQNKHSHLIHVPVYILLFFKLL